MQQQTTITSQSPNKALTWRLGLAFSLSFLLIFAFIGRKETIPDLVTSSRNGDSVGLEKNGDRNLQACTVDAALLNELIELVRPAVNEILQAWVPDPWDLSFLGGVSKTFPGRLALLTCSVYYPFLDLWAVQFRGLSTVTIEKLELVEGTETIACECFGITNWAGKFRIELQSNSELRFDWGAKLDLNGTKDHCKNIYTTTADVTVKRPFFSGVIDLAGVLNGRSMDINQGKFIENLILEWSDLDVELHDVDWWLNSLIDLAEDYTTSQWKQGGRYRYDENALPKEQEGVEYSMVNSETTLVPVTKAWNLHTRVAVKTVARSASSFLGWDDADAEGYADFEWGDDDV